MSIDRGLAKSLTLLRTSPDFVLTQRADGSMIVSNPSQITPDMGVVWLAADTVLANKHTLDTVLVIDTATGDMPRAVYWFFGGNWVEPADPDTRAPLLTTLGLTHDDVFPYQTATKIPLSLG